MVAVRLVAVAPSRITSQQGCKCDANTKGSFSAEASSFECAVVTVAPAVVAVAAVAGAVVAVAVAAAGVVTTEMQLPQPSSVASPRGRGAGHRLGPRRDRGHERRDRDHPGHQATLDSRDRGRDHRYHPTATTLNTAAANTRPRPPRH
eukprot:gene8007-12999_t